MLVGHFNVDVGGDGIGQTPGILDLAQLHRGFGGQLLVELGVILKLLGDRAHQRGGFRSFGGNILDRFDIGDQMRARLRHRRQPRAMLALDKHAHRAIGQLEQLQHDRDDTRIIERILTRIILGRVELRHQEDFLIAFHRRFQRGDALVATDEERDDHLRKDDDVTQRQKGILHSHSHSGPNGACPTVHRLYGDAYRVNQSGDVIMRSR